MSEALSLVLIGLVGGLVVAVGLILLSIVNMAKCQQEIRDLLKNRKD